MRRVTKRRICDLDALRVPVVQHRRDYDVRIARGHEFHRSFAQLAVQTGLGWYHGGKGVRIRQPASASVLKALSTNDCG